MPPNLSQTAIVLENIAMTFPSGTEALRPITFEIPRGEFVCLLGPSGCGKSTLLRVVAELQEPTSGKVVNGLGENALSYVFQDAHLLPWRSVLQNVALPLELAGTAKPARLAAAKNMLAQVGLADFYSHYPAQLSGGMKMRVSLARALVSEPALLLLDEPFAAVDEMTRQKLDEQLLELWRKQGMTVIFVTHSVTEAVFLGQRAIVFSPRPGRLVLDHAVDLPEERNLALRSDARFAEQCGILYRALERGERVMRTIRGIVPPAITFVGALLLWAGLKKLFGLSDFTLPSPVEVAAAFGRYAGPLLRATLTTAESAMTGFGLSIVVGVVAGILLSSSRWVERAVYPFTVFLQTVPLVAIAPILVLWFDTGFTSVTICAFIVSVFPVIANTLLGMRSVDPALHDLFTIYHASAMARLFKLKLPSALPSIFTGLRIAAGLAVIGAIVGEFSAGTFTNEGLGILILSAKRMFNMDEVFAAVFLASMLGLAAFAGVNLAAYWLLGGWHVSEQRGAAHRR